MASVGKWWRRRDRLKDVAAVVVRLEDDSYHGIYSWELKIRVIARLAIG